MPSSSPDVPGCPPLEGQLVVFTGKLSSLGRRDARALVARLGGATADDVNAKTTMLVVGAEGFGQTDKSNKLKRAEEMNAQSGGVAIRILTEEDFCRLTGVPTPDALKRQYNALRDLLARYRALREDHVRYLVKCGVLRPMLRTNADTFFAFPDVAVIKQANEGLDQGASFRSIVRTLLASRVGQLEFDFRLDAAPAKIIALRRPAGDTPPASAPPVGTVDMSAPLTRDTALAEEYFRAASLLDDSESTQGEAAAAYRKALEYDPYLVAAIINLANIHYSRDELAEAQALYERAIGLESDFFEAHFNLGNIYHDLGRFPEALACYREALRLNPFYADAHFYLAVTFEKMGLSQDARPHWRAYQQLAPQGEWVELAKEFSE
ncbi:MAG: tetratricopeptide repeat protein [Acidobacteria bacterium]|nr:tetratricopeptide repeat protein [Acidobacteriota bacterium]